MSVSQKRAWYNLVVIGTTLVLVVVLIPVLGPGAPGQFRAARAPGAHTGALSEEGGDHL